MSHAYTSFIEFGGITWVWKRFLTGPVYVPVGHEVFFWSSNRMKGYVVEGTTNEGGGPICRYRSLDSFEEINNLTTHVGYSLTNASVWLSVGSAVVFWSPRQKRWLSICRKVDTEGGAQFRVMNFRGEVELPIRVATRHLLEASEVAP